MKFTGIILTSLFTVIFLSCNSGLDGTMVMLQQAEQCMEAYPDSALQLLNGIHNPDKLADKERAEYLLLLTQARDKNYMDLSSDSSITFAVDYFEKSGDKRKYGKALYYYGRVLQRKKDAPQAMKVFLDARQILEETDEYKMLGLLLTDISILNREQSLYDVAIDNCRQAINSFSKLKDTMGIAYTYQTMGSCFFLKKEMDSVYYCATKSLNLLSDNPIRLRIASLKMLGMMYSFQKQYAKAEKVFLEIIEKEPDKKKLVSHYMSLGRLYWLMGKKEEAQKYLMVCLESQNLFTRSAAYTSLADLAKLSHDYKQALEFKEKSDSLMSIAESKEIREDLIQLQAKFQQEKSEKEKLQIILKNRTMLFVLIVVSVLLLGITHYFRKRYWCAKVQMEEIQKMLEKNNRQIESYLSEIECFKTLENEKEMEASNKIANLNHQINVLIKENAELRSKVDVSELMKILKCGEVIAENLTSTEWDKIFKLVNCLHHDILINLKKEYELTKRNIQLLAFHLLGFTPKELMIIFDSKDIRNISKAKSRLKERLKLKKEDSLEDFLRKKHEEKTK